MADFKVLIPPSANTIFRDERNRNITDDVDEISDACLTIVDAINIAVIKCKEPITLRILLHLGGYSKTDLKRAYDFVVATNKTEFIKEFQRAGM